MGKIVFCLIEAKWIGANDSDVIEDFHNVYQFDDEFQKTHFPLSTYRNSAKPFQLSIATLFVCTVVIAVVAAGAIRHGLPGAVKSLFCGWFILIGVWLVWRGVSENWITSLLLLIIGALFFSAGFFLFNI